jgi:hypothetical protein
MLQLAQSFKPRGEKGHNMKAKLLETKLTNRDDAETIRNGSICIASVHKLLTNLK